MWRTGVIHGRFQILHNDHMRYLLAGKRRCNHLVIGITNPDPTLTRPDISNPERSAPWSNPLSYFERFRMVQLVMLENHIDPSEFSIVPFPINLPDLYKYYVPINAVFFLTIYDSWGERKLELFTSLGLQTEIMWRRPENEKGLSASEVRLKIANCEEWESLVPHAVGKFIKENRIDKRLQSEARRRAACA